MFKKTLLFVVILLATVATIAPAVRAEDVIPQIYFANTTASCKEGDRTKNLEVKLSKAYAKTVTCKWTAEGTNTYDGAQSSSYGSGADFSPASGKLSFSPGITSQNIILTIIDGTAAEPDQKLSVRLSNPINATVKTGSESCQLTIADNDRDCLLTMTSLPSSCPIGRCSGWRGSG